MSSLPEGAHLAYIVNHEAWYRREVADQREIRVVAYADTGPNLGMAWEFRIEETPLGIPGLIPIYACVSNRAFTAFAQFPEFFAALAAEKVTTLDQVRGLLDRLGAKDETRRENAAGDPRDVDAKRPWTPAGESA